MVEAAVALPEPRPEDDEDVVWGLSTASALWARGERHDAIVWLRRAAEAAIAAGQDFRASEIGMYASELEDALSSPSATAPGARPLLKGPLEKGPLEEDSGDDTLVDTSGIVEEDTIADNEASRKLQSSSPEPAPTSEAPHRGPSSSIDIEIDMTPAPLTPPPPRTPTAAPKRTNPPPGVGPPASPGSVPPTNLGTPPLPSFGPPPAPSFGSSPSPAFGPPPASPAFGPPPASPAFGPPPTAPALGPPLAPSSGQ